MQSRSLNDLFLAHRDDIQSSVVWNMITMLYRRQKSQWYAKLNESVGTRTILSTSSFLAGHVQNPYPNRTPTSRPTYTQLLHYIPPISRNEIWRVVDTRYSSREFAGVGRRWEGGTAHGLDIDGEIRIVLLRVSQQSTNAQYDQGHLRLACEPPLPDRSAGRRH